MDKDTKLQWLALGVTIIVTLVSWIALWAGDRRELINRSLEHERRITELEKSSREADVAMVEIRNDVKWIRRELEKGGAR